MNGTDCRGLALLHASNGATLHYDVVVTQWINRPAQTVYFLRTDPRNVETLTLTNA